MIVDLNMNYMSDFSCNFYLVSLAIIAISSSVYMFYSQYKIKLLKNKLKTSDTLLISETNHRESIEKQLDIITDMHKIKKQKLNVIALENAKLKLELNENQKILTELKLKYRNAVQRDPDTGRYLKS